MKRLFSGIIAIIFVVSLIFAGRAAQYFLIPERCSINYQQTEEKTPDQKKK